jgi:uncharacterized membrane protein
MGDDMSTIRDQIEQLDGEELNFLTQMIIVVHGTMHDDPDKMERMLALLAVNVGGLIAPAYIAGGHVRVDKLLAEFSLLIKEQMAMAVNEMRSGTQ